MASGHHLPMVLTSGQVVFLKHVNLGISHLFLYPLNDFFFFEFSVSFNRSF